VHEANAAPSSEHSKLDPDSLEVKLKLADVLVVDDGGAPAPIVVFGAVVSGAVTVHEREAGEPSTLPEASLARTRNWWEPADRPL
jgi:hypothetical protein